MKPDQQQVQEAYLALQRIAKCATEVDLANLTKTIVTLLGASAYVYSTLISDDRSEERRSFRYLIGCDPRWCQMYIERKWFMNDPYVEYGRTHTEPIFGSRVVPKTEEQAEMLRLAGNYGFRSGIGIPTHSSQNAKQRMGILYIGSDLEPALGEALLGQNRILFRALGHELLDWWIHHLRQEAAAKYGLDDQEIALLQLAKDGLAIAKISAKLGVTDSRIYRRFDVIKDKLGVRMRDAAVKVADAAGLLG